MGVESNIPNLRLAFIGRSGRKEFRSRSLCQIWICIFSKWIHIWIKIWTCLVIKRSCQKGSGTLGSVVDQIFVLDLNGGSRSFFWIGSGLSSGGRGGHTRPLQNCTTLCALRQIETPCAGWQLQLPRPNTPCVGYKALSL